METSGPLPQVERIGEEKHWQKGDGVLSVGAKMLKTSYPDR